MKWNSVKDMCKKELLKIPKTKSECRAPTAKPKQQYFELMLFVKDYVSYVSRSTMIGNLEVALRCFHQKAVSRSITLVTYKETFESHMQVACRCAPWKIASCAEHLVVQTLHFQKMGVCRNLPGWAGISLESVAGMVSLYTPSGISLISNQEVRYFCVGPW